jgi:hypothetical protein
VYSSLSFEAAENSGAAIEPPMDTVGAQRTTSSFLSASYTRRGQQTIYIVDTGSRRSDG